MQYSNGSTLLSKCFANYSQQFDESHFIKWKKLCGVQIRIFSINESDKHFIIKSFSWKCNLKAQHFN